MDICLGSRLVELSTGRLEQKRGLAEDGRMPRGASQGQSERALVSVAARMLEFIVVRYILWCEAVAF